MSEKIVLKGGRVVDPSQELDGMADNDLGLDRLEALVVPVARRGPVIVSR